MPKKYGQLYSKITDIDNIKFAHQNAKRDKSFYAAVIKTTEHLDERAEKIQKMLVNHSYKVSPYKTSVIIDKTKRRILYKLPYYPDRIIQWAIMQQIEPIFKKTFVDFTCASIPGRGIRKASNLINKWINTYLEQTKYCLKFDIKKFYPSINRIILKQLLRKKIKDKDLLIELDKIIDSMENCDISHLNLSQKEKEIYMQSNKGLPVGSYLSQYLANYYLTFFDHWLKEVLKCKFVVRYMDDIIILNESKEKLWNILYQIKKYLQDNLDLEIKSNYQVFLVDSRGIDFVGYRHFRGYKLLRKTTLKTCKQIAKKINECQIKNIFPSEKDWCAWVSSIGLLTQCDSYKIYNKYYINSIPIINAFYTLYKKGKNRRLTYQFMIPYFIPYYKKKYYTFYSHPKIHQK